MPFAQHRDLADTSVTSDPGNSSTTKPRLSPCVLLRVAVLLAPLPPVALPPVVAVVEAEVIIEIKVAVELGLRGRHSAAVS